MKAYLHIQPITNEEAFICSYKRLQKRMKSEDFVEMELTERAIKSLCIRLFLLSNVYQEKYFTLVFTKDEKSYALFQFYNKKIKRFEKAISKNHITPILEKIREKGSINLEQLLPKFIIGDQLNMFDLLEEGML